MCCLGYTHWQRGLNGVSRSTRVFDGVSRLTHSEAVCQAVWPWPHETRRAKTVEMVNKSMQIVAISLKITEFRISDCWYFHAFSIHLKFPCWPAQHLRAKSHVFTLQTLRFERNIEQNPMFLQCKRYDFYSKSA